MSTPKDKEKRYKSGAKHQKKNLPPCGYNPWSTTARQVAKTPEFIAACEKVGTKPTERQARDYRRGIGKFA